MSGLDNTLRALRAAGDRGCTGNELEAAGSGKRYSARIAELNKLGWHVEPERIRNDPVIYRWTLISEPGAGRERTVITAPAAPGCETDTLFADDAQPSTTRSAITGQPL